MTETFSPAVSVIVPVYNAEKYLPVCLESLLIQTFTDFEVLVVDDCSTDSSLTIAESFLERFGGRLKIVSLLTNNGAPAVPRNVGLGFARGKYVYFIDDDDFVVDNALETLFSATETFSADVVYMERNFTCGEEFIPTEIDIADEELNNFVEVPTFEPDDLSERVENFLSLRYRWPPWAKFVRRDLLVDNDIKFPPMRTSEDILWTLKLLCFAKKILRIPEPLYVNRQHGESITRIKRADKQMLQLWTSPLLNGMDLFCEFMSRTDFFKGKFKLQLRLLNLFAVTHLTQMQDATKTLPQEELYEIFLREFVKAGSSQPALISYLLTMNNLYRNELMK